jgi:hypothetical protein
VLPARSVGTDRHRSPTHPPRARFRRPPCGHAFRPQPACARRRRVALGAPAGANTGIAGTVSSTGQRVYRRAREDPGRADRLDQPTTITPPDRVVRLDLDTDREGSAGGVWRAASPQTRGSARTAAVGRRGQRALPTPPRVRRRRPLASSATPTNPPSSHPSAPATLPPRGHTRGVRSIVAHRSAAQMSPRNKDRQAGQTSVACKRLCGDRRAPRIRGDPLADTKSSSVRFLGQTPCHLQPAASLGRAPTRGGQR